MKNELSIDGQGKDLQKQKAWRKYMFVGAGKLFEKWKRNRVEQLKKKITKQKEIYRFGVTGWNFLTEFIFS